MTVEENETKTNDEKEVETRFEGLTDNLIRSALVIGHASAANLARRFANEYRNRDGAVGGLLAEAFENFAVSLEEHTQQHLDNEQKTSS